MAKMEDVYEIFRWLSNENRKAVRNNPQDTWVKLMEENKAVFDKKWKELGLPDLED